VGDSRVWGINTIGAKRAGLNTKDLAALKFAHSALYREKLSLTSALKKLNDSPAAPAREIAAFIEASRRGICGPKTSGLWERIFIDYPYLVRSQIAAFYQYRKARRHGNFFKSVQV